MNSDSRVSSSRRSFSALLIAPLLLGSQPASPTVDLYILFSADPVTEQDGGITGPFPQSIVIDQVAAADVGGVSAREELIVGDGSTLRYLDLDSQISGWTVISPPPPVVFDALTALDFEGSTAKDLVAAAGSYLFVLDLDRVTPIWSGPLPQPFTLATLTSLDLGGVSPRREIIASSGTGIQFLDLDSSGGSWQTLTPPPSFPVDGLFTLDIFVGDLQAPVELLVAMSSTDLHVFHVGQWFGPFPGRYRIRALAIVDLDGTGGPPVSFREGVAVIEAAQPSTIQFSNQTDLAGLSGYVSPGGDGHCPGAVFTDIDGDGFPDLYLVRGGEPNQLYLNDGQGGFDLQIAALGAADPGNSSGAVTADYDNDGDTDIYVTNFGGRNTLYRNDSGLFVDVTEATDPTPLDPVGDDQFGVGIAMILSGCDNNFANPCSLHHSLSAAWGDFDRDGWLDLFVGNHRCCGFPDGERDVLYRNNGDGTFTDITVASGVAEDSPLSGALSTQALLVADFNNDRWPDIYITHKGDGPSRDELYLNDGDRDGDDVWDGSFTEYYRTLAPGSPLGWVSGAAMGIDIGDYDNDGDLDIYIADIGEMDFYRNLQSESGVFALELLSGPLNPAPGAPFSWGINWFDADNDGQVDLHISTNDMVMDYLYRNNGDGSFTDVALAAGVGQAWETRANVTADYDRDGWVDYFTPNRGGRPPTLYRNTTGARSENHWIQISLEGDPALSGPYRSTRDAIGARVTVLADVDGNGTAEVGESQIREVSSGAHNCSSTSSPWLQFGLGRALFVERVTVEWPDGRVSTHSGLNADQFVEIVEGSVVSVPDPGASLPGLVTLSRNQPNPFATTTRIAFTLAPRGLVKLSVYDTRGRRVRTLIDGVLPAGRHTVIWDARDGDGSVVAAGLYLLHLEAVGEARSRKMMIVR